jgi:hypothetical protein
LALIGVVKTPISSGLGLILVGSIGINPMFVGQSGQTKKTPLMTSPSLELYLEFDLSSGGASQYVGVSKLIPSLKPGAFCWGFRQRSLFGQVPCDEAGVPQEQGLSGWSLVTQLYPVGLFQL